MHVNEGMRLPGLTDDEQRILDALFEQLKAKTSRNIIRAGYYDGKRGIHRLSPVLPPYYNTLNAVLGWSSKAVDVLAQRCNLDGYVWPDGDLESLGLQQVYDDNQLSSQVDSGQVSSLIHSVSFLINHVGMEGEPASLISVKDALNATGTWNWRTFGLDNLLSITDRDSEGYPSAVALYLPNETIEGFKDGGRWSIERTEHNLGVPAEAMIFKQRESRPFGSSRISRAVMSMHDAALRTFMRMEGHADIHSFPEYWLLGADMSIFRNADGTIQPAWQVMLGRIKGVPDDEEVDPQLARADIKQFQAASPEAHLDMLKQQAQLFSGETSIPLSSLGISDMSNPTSADSYIASREDLISTAEAANDGWSPALRRCMIRALAIKNDLTKIPESWRTIDVKFRSPIHLSRAAAADAGMKQLTAAPWLAETSVGLELLGLSDQQIARALSEKRRAQGAATITALAANMARQKPVTEQLDDIADAG